MIDESIGIRMCRHRRIRKQYGTVVYQETNVVLPDPKKHYDEIHELIKKEEKQNKKRKKETKKIDIEKMTKEKQIEKLIDLPMDIQSDVQSDVQSGENHKTDLPTFQDESVEKIIDLPEEKEKEEEENKEIKIEELEEKEEIENKQEGGLLTNKKIYVTDLSVEKDKEMFQM